MNGRPWTDVAVAELCELAATGLSEKLIARRLNRTTTAIRFQASQRKIKIGTQKRWDQSEVNHLDSLLEKGLTAAEIAPMFPDRNYDATYAKIWRSYRADYAKIEKRQ